MMPVWMSQIDFSSFWEGLSLRCPRIYYRPESRPTFPYFLEGLSLRHGLHSHFCCGAEYFPFLFGGAFIEAGVTAWMIPNLS